MSFLVIGASSKIAQELITRLGQKNHEIITISRSAIENPKIKKHFQLDVTRHDIELPHLEEPLAGLIYLPGTMNLKPFNNLKLENFQQDYHINFLSCVRCLEKYLPNLEKASNSSIVLMSTVAVQLGLSYHASISASKGAIEGLARSLAAEFSPKIRVNCIAPSLLETPLAKPILDRPGQKELSDKRHPLHRIGQATDVAAMAEFLLTEPSSWITGQVLHVDGGMSSLRLF